MNFYDATTGMYNHRELLKQMKHLDKNIDICLLRMLQSVVIQRDQMHLISHWGLGKI